MPVKQQTGDEKKPQTTAFNRVKTASNAIPMGVVLLVGGR
jgi:hypothetical protein